MIELRNEKYIDPEGTRPTKLVAAAILQDGRIWTGARHGNLIPQVIEDGGTRVTQDQQGFLTDDNRFVRRAAGMAIAIRYGQVVQGKTISRDLTSEDLW